MNPIKVPVTFSPHIVGGKPRGYYALAQWLFPNGAPILQRRQFAGYNGQLLITVEKPMECKTLLHMALKVSTLQNTPIMWLGACKVYHMSRGFRAYIPGSILCPPSAESEKIETHGFFRRHGDLFYMEFPKVSAEVLLGKERFEK